jgi:hypothetical protein
MKPQFTLVEYTTNENGEMFVEKTHFPIFWTSLNLVQNLSFNIDYSLICVPQKLYNISPNTKYFILLLNCQD